MRNHFKRIQDKFPRYKSLNDSQIDRIVSQMWRHFAQIDLSKFFVRQTQKSFRNLIKSNRNQIVFTIFRLILNQMDIRLVPNLVCNKQNMKIKTRELRQKYSLHCILKSLRVTYTSMHMHITYVINNNISIDNILHTVSITNKIIPTNNILHTLS